MKPSAKTGPIARMQLFLQVGKPVRQALYETLEDRRDLAITWHTHPGQTIPIKMGRSGTHAAEALSESVPDVSSDFRLWRAIML